MDLLALPFDQYQRYTAAAQIAAQVRAHLGQASLHVLDVGGFFRTRQDQGILPLSHFLPEDRVVAVDLIAESLPNYVLASGLSLSFGDKAFDLVVSCDTLEHVPSASRCAFVDELLRVTDRYLVLIAPFDGSLTRQAEQYLHQYLTVQGIHNQQLQEHLAYGLPSADSLRISLKERGLVAVDLPDGYLPYWLTMMLIKHTPGQSPDFYLELDSYYNRHLSPGDHHEPAYRRTFVVAQPGNEALLAGIADALQPTDIPPANPNLDFASDLIHLLDSTQRTGPVPALRQAESQVAALEAENSRLRQMIAGYERGYFIRLTRWLHSQRERLRR
jgi:hypothetical protein